MCLSSFFLNKETLYTYHTLLACLPVGRDWGHQHFLAFMSDASINIRVQGVAWTCVVSSPGWTRTRRTVGSYGGYTSDFLINRKTMSQSSGSAALPPAGGGVLLCLHTPISAAPSAVLGSRRRVCSLTAVFEVTLLKVQCSFPLSEVVCTAFYPRNLCLTQGHEHISLKIFFQKF